MQNGSNVHRLFGMDDHRRAGLYPAFRGTRWYRVRKRVGKWLARIARKVSP